MSNYRRAFIENSYIFITVVTYNRIPVLIKNIEFLRNSFRHVKERYRFEIFASVILPDHMHLILIPENIYEYPQILSALKHNFSRNFNRQEKLPESKLNKREKGIWQRRYYEHTIIDEQGLEKHLDYIHYNPVKHLLVKNVKDWKYSSFEQFVKKEYYEINWGNDKDVEYIESLDLE